MKLLSPKEAADVMGTSPQTITAMVKLGAPVHRWGPSGYRYKIDVDEWLAWQDAFHEGKNYSRTGTPAKAQAPGTDGNILLLSTAQMAKRRHDLMAALA